MSDALGVEHLLLAPAVQIGWAACIDINPSDAFEPTVLKNAADKVPRAHPQIALHLELSVLLL